jgi:flagellum-specific ATP synthase
MDEPIADAVRAISDGHIVLSRKLASRNHYPAIDVMESVSRVMGKVVSKEHKIISSHLRDLMASYQEAQDLINVGAYAHGTNPKVDKAILIYDRLMDVLKQDVDDPSTIDNVFEKMLELAREAEAAVNPEFDAGGE